MAEGSSDVDSIDPYFYTKLDEFTSEVFKIEVSNLPSKFGYVDMRKRMSSMNLKPIKIKIIPKSDLVFMTFSSEEERLAALTAVDGHVWKNHTLSAKTAKPCADPMALKRKQTYADGDSSKGKVTKLDDEDDLPMSERLNNSVTPLWKVPYSEQLEIKHKSIADVLKQTFRQLERDYEWMAPTLRQDRLKYGLHCCNLLPTIPSPVTTKYRNKCELTIGLNSDGKDKVIGFRLGTYKGGSRYVGEPSDCIIMPDSMKQIVKIFEDCLSTSTRPAFNPETHLGCWRQLTLRTSQRGHIMAIVEFKGHGLTKEEIDAEICHVKSYISEHAKKDCQVTSLYFNINDTRGTNSSDANITHVLGDQTIEEDLMGLKFRVSPDAFFQVNTKAAELLYDTIGQWVCGGNETTNENPSDKNTSDNLVNENCRNNYGLETPTNVNTSITDECMEEAPELVENTNSSSKKLAIKNSKESCTKIETNENLSEQGFSDIVTNENALNVVCSENPTNKDASEKACSVISINKTPEIEPVPTIPTNENASNESSSAITTNENASNKSASAIPTNENTSNKSSAITMNENVSDTSCSTIATSEKVSNENLTEMKEKANDENMSGVESAQVSSNTTNIQQKGRKSVGTVLLDICCGTGTIGLTLAKRVEKVIGIEMCQQAVQDAIHNASINGISNATYHCGKAEDLISSVMSSVRGYDVVAVIDPPRPGLHNHVIHALRACSRLKKLIYVSCSPKSAKTNFIDLMRPTSKRMRGDPFKIVKAVPVDLFPHTNHCELVISFER